MKKKSEVKNERLGLAKSFALVLLAILVSVLSGASFWLMFVAAGVFVLLRFIGLKFITNAIVLLGFLFIMPIVLESFYPRTSSSILHSRARLDQVITQALPDKADVVLADIFTKEKNIAQAVFITDYQEMLRQGKTEEARDSLKSFQIKWSLKKEEISKISNEVTEELVDYPERIYSTGNYEILVEGETPFYIVIDYKNEVKKGFKIESEENNFSVILKDGRVFDAYAKLPYMDVYKLRVMASREKELVTLRIY